MKVALFGGTGFVGSYLVDELLQKGHEPVLLVRPGSESKVIRRENCTLIPGHIDDAEAVRATLNGCEAVIFSIGIIREDRKRGQTFDQVQFVNAKAVMDAAIEMNVRRFILMSANGVRPDGTAYQRSKFMAEEFLKTTDLEWTIFRPSVIFGDPRGTMEFCTQLRDDLIRLPLPMPMFYKGVLPTGAGSFLLSPIHIRDIAAMFVRALELPEAVGRTFELGGKDTLSWQSMLRIIAQASGRRKWSLPVPVFPLTALAALLDRFAFFPITRDQLTMLVEGNSCDPTEALTLFGIDPIPFQLDNLKYLQEH